MKIKLFIGIVALILAAASNTGHEPSVPVTVPVSPPAPVVDVGEPASEAPAPAQPPVVKYYVPQPVYRQYSSSCAGGDCGASQGRPRLFGRRR